MPATHLYHSRRRGRLAGSAALIILFAAASLAQTPLNGFTPSGIEAGSPAEAYALSGFENVSLFSGGLNVALPLLKVGGRGEAGYTIMLRPVRTKWVVQYAALGFGASYNYPSNEWWSAFTPGYGPGTLEGRRGGAEPCAVSNLVFTLTRLTFTAADGTEYELRDTLTGGATQEVGCRDDGQPVFNRGKVFATADGTSATFISDADIKDYTNGGIIFQPSGYLMFGNGVRYRISNGGVDWMRDRNGNQLKFTGTTTTKIVDSLNREVEIEYDVNDVAPYGHCDRITYKGFGGQPRVIRISEAPMSTSMQEGETTKQYYELFDGMWGAQTYGVYDDFRVTAVWLPDGRSYKFRYNSYGEIGRIELPTGGAIEYDYGPGTAYAYASGLIDLGWGGESPGDAPYMKQTILRRVWVRREYPNGGTGTSFARRTLYSGSASSCGPDPESTVGVLHYKPNGTMEGIPVGGTQHWFYGSPCGSVQWAITNPSYSPPWKEGREFRTDSLAPDGQTLLRKVEMKWEQPAAGTTWPLTLTETNAGAKTNRPQVTEIKTTLTDTGQVSKQTFAFDQYGNRTDIYEHDFGAAPGTAGPLIRRTHTDFVSAAAYVNASIDPLLGPHLRSLPQESWVSADGGSTNKLSLTVYDYDQFGLTPRASITGLCVTCPNAQCTSANPTSLVTRGNVTRVTRYANPAGRTGPHASTSTYDVAGNVVSMADANGNTTQLSYDDSICNALGCTSAFNGTFTPNSYAFPTSTTSPVPDVSVELNMGYAAGTFGSTSALTTATVYDFHTGQVYSMTDPNNKKTTLEYDDPLDRLTAVIRPAGGGRTDFDYSEPEEAGVYVRTLTDLDSTRRVQKKQYFDGLGRPFRTMAYENQDPANPWVVTDIGYDPFGRVRHTSTPYRSADSVTPLTESQWASAARSETEYDALGRVKTITTRPDGAVVNTAYSGNRALVTDPAGKQRISKTDALGRITEVWEVAPNDPARYPGVEAIPSAVTDGLSGSAHGYPTGYTYDAQGNLRTVTQGTQPARVFAYDPLLRLTSATNPESGTVGYTYDANGNVRTRTDARGVTATYTYDRLNRNIITSYAGGGTDTPPVFRHYDNPTELKNGLGRFWWSYTGVGAGVTATGVNEYDAMGRVLERHQNFVADGHSFSVKLEYNLAGGVTKQTYPSGREVTYSYDAAGRPSGFAGKLGDGVQRTYSDQISYSEFGGVQQERFGTQTPLYHKRHYNRRGQLFDIRLSTVAWAADQWNWNRGAVVNYYSGNHAWEGDPNTPASSDNNGNLRRQQSWVPGDDWYNGYAYAQDTFEYDALNRLIWVKEVHGGAWGQSGEDFAQYFDYDRWGNRTINPATTDGMPEPQFSVNSANNQLGVPAGYGGRMDYDATGNLTNDTHTSFGRGDGTPTRIYDAENRLTLVKDGNLQTVSAYTYDADGRRVRRKVANEEWWQVYGVGGELLAEYPAGAATFLAAKEYGYRGGQLLVTMSSGDVDRLRRFVKNLFYNCLERDPSASELAEKMNQLAQAGAQGGETQLLSTARAIARGLFESTEYVNRNRTTEQYVTDLYIAYLQRGPDTGGLNHWVGNTNQYGRGATLNAFEVCTEFEVLSATVYGTAAGGEDQRADTFVRNFYYGAFQREPNATEAQAGRQRLNDAAAVSRDQVIAEARAMGVELIQSTNYISNHTVEQYVTDLYLAFLQRAPDGLGLNHWVNNTNQYGRAATLDAFRLATEYSELAGTLYRETFWLIPDHLGTPRMVAHRTGSLAGVKRHDYLPFGEELSAGTSGRAQGYGGVDNVRQKFTGYERDEETWLDYAQARHYSSGQGRFTGVDPGPFTPADPQSWNRYAYVQNNPLKFIDPTGTTLTLTGDDAEELLRELELKTGYKLIRDPKTGNVTIDESVKRSKAGTSKHLAEMLKTIINDKETLQLHTETPAPDVPHAFIDGGSAGAGKGGYINRVSKTFYMDDYRAANAKDSKFAATLLGHVLKEGHGFMVKYLYMKYPGGEPHDLAKEFESKVMSDLTGQKEQTRAEAPIGSEATGFVGFKFIYTSVSYDVYHKQVGPPASNTIILVNNKNCGCKK